MTSSRNIKLLTMTAAGVLMIWMLSGSGTPQAAAASVNVGKKSIGGVVTSSKGPEAGVWVIAQTKDLPAPYTKIVVTDDQGRYVVPDLPPANYTVWVRGYGLVDSKPQSAALGKETDLKAEVAPDPQTAAKVYPAAWWASMMKFPDDKAEQRKMVLDMKECYDCHQLGNDLTRHIEHSSVPNAKTTMEAWDQRTKLGPSGPSMGGFFQAFGAQKQMFVDWVDSIAKGAAPMTPPSRPQGLERNLVITEWDWGLPKQGRSDAAAADTRNPRINANGPMFEVSEMTDTVNIVYPTQNKTEIIKVNTEAPKLISGFNAADSESPYAGHNPWERNGDPRSVAIDAKGRAWMTLRNRANTSQPAWCTSPDNKYAAWEPIKQGGKQVAVYDPKTKTWEHIDTCFTPDHNEIGEDNVIYYGHGSGIAWVDINMWDKTHDSEKSQGWCQGVLDTNGSGKIEKGWTEADQPVDPTKDHRARFGSYGVAINLKDGAVWMAGIGRGDKRLARVVKGNNPPESCVAEFYEPPSDTPLEVFGSGGVTVDPNGVVWQNWRVSGHFTSFDRSKCKSTKDPQATGKSCPEGWSVYRDTSVPTYQNSVYTTQASYLTHIDYWDVLGMGKGVPLYGTTNLDALVAFNPATKEFVHLHIPYPMGFMPRAATGRIDDPKTGWKGKGLWTDYGMYAQWHMEGGYGTLPKAVKMQMRPNPLAD